MHDNGPGVSAEVLSRLVRPFERGITAAEGSGLGLAIVSAIARQSGVRLKLQSPIAAGRGFAATLEFGAQPRGLEDLPRFDPEFELAHW